jgi:arsenite methyltransferase
MEPTQDQIKASIKERYADLARFPDSEKAFPVGPESAKALGYSAGEIDSLPASVTESFAGVGNPFLLGELHAGQTVLDLGCGAGMDAVLAARKVGPSGRVIGVDITEAMMHKARQNAEGTDLTNVEFHQGDVESLPLATRTVDVVISNGVFNLCLNKPAVVSEAFRVLRAGGRLLMADMLLEDHVTPEKVQLMGSWSG